MIEKLALKVWTLKLLISIRGLHVTILRVCESHVNKSINCYLEFIAYTQHKYLLRFLCIEHNTMYVFSYSKMIILFVRE